MTILEWRKCVNPCSGNWSDIETVAIIASSNIIMNVQGSTYITPSTGALTMLHFVTENEGLYRCIWDHHEPYDVELIQYESK